MNDENKNIYYQTLVDTMKTESKYFDNALLTLSSGGLGLILTVIKNKTDELDSYLKVSSVLFLLTIITILISSYLSIRAHQIALYSLSNNTKYDCNTCLWNKMNNFITPSSFILFFLACVFLVIRFW